jgi:hypothetical protein
MSDIVTRRYVQAGMAAEYYYINALCIGQAVSTLNGSGFQGVSYGSGGSSVHNEFSEVFPSMAEARDWFFAKLALRRLRGARV